MSTTFTRDQLAGFAADELGLTSSGNDAEAEDLAKIDDRIDGFIYELAARNIVSAGQTAEFPIEWRSCLSSLLANDCATLFARVHISEDERLDLESRLLTTVLAQPPSQRTLQVDSALKAWGTTPYTHTNWQSGR